MDAHKTPSDTILDHADSLTVRSAQNAPRDFWESLETLAEEADHWSRAVLMAKLVIIAEHDEESVPKGMARLMNKLRLLMSAEP